MALNDFHSACRNWYIVEFGAPTPAQAEAWSAIRSGRHTLISAPTGSRKTLAAFYAAPPWRVLLHTLRKMKLRGVLRGGAVRFRSRWRAVCTSRNSRKSQEVQTIKRAG